MTKHNADKKLPQKDIKPRGTSTPSAPKKRGGRGKSDNMKQTGE